MKKIYILMFIFIFADAYADGPPVDTLGNVHGKYFAIKLNESQVKEIGRNRTLKFTNKQYNYLRKKLKNLKRKIFVLTPFYNDCTCDLIYGIWNRRDSVAIPDYMSDMLKEENSSGQTGNDQNSGQEKEKCKNIKSGLSEWPMIQIDLEGNIYFRNNRKSKKGLFAMIREMASLNGNDGSIYVSRPPKTDKETDDNILKLIGEITIYAKKYKISVEVAG